MSSGRCRLLAGLVAAWLASCSTAPAEQVRTRKADDEIAQALAGRVAGPPHRCISNFPNTQARVIDDWTILYDEGRTIYVQNPKGGCPGIGNGSRTLVARQVGTSQMCEGDINQVVDLRSGIGGPTCVFGPFVPYTKAKS